MADDPVRSSTPPPEFTQDVVLRPDFVAKPDEVTVKIPPPPTPDGRPVFRQLQERIGDGRAADWPVVQGYRLDRELGRGTFGIVWKAVDENGTEVAIKFFAYGASDQWRAVHAEVRRLVALDGAPGIVQIKDVNLDADPPYFVMSYAAGGSLADRLRAAKGDGTVLLHAPGAAGPAPGKTPPTTAERPAGLGVPEALRIAQGIARGLAYVHAKGILHCDLKPGNVLLDHLGQPLLADFGQARLPSDASPALGTFYYMAPEQADIDRPVPDTWWDVYSLGAVFYAMVCGTPPRFDPALQVELQGTANLASRLRRYREVVTAAPRPDGHRRVRGMDSGLAAIIDRCLDINPGRRPPNAAAVFDLIRRWQRRRRQRPLLVAAALAPLLLLAVLGGFGWWAKNQLLEKSRGILREELAQSSESTANFVADTLAEKLSRQAGRLNGIAGDPRLAELVSATTANMADIPAADLARNDVLVDERRRLKEWMTGAYGKVRGDFKAHMAVANARGHLLMYAKPLDNGFDWPDTAEKLQPFATNLSYRAWFNGEENKAGVGVHKPCPRTSISPPFVPKVRNPRLGINITVPIRDDRGAIVGVLTAGIPWGDFTRWLHGRGRFPGEGGPGEASFPAIVNHRGHYLSHQDVDEIRKELRRNQDEPASNPPARFPVATRDERIPGPTGRLTAFKDPLDEERSGRDGRPATDWIAGYSRFHPLAENADEEWTVLVLNDPEKAMDRTDEIVQQTRRQGWLLLAASGLLLVALWGYLVRQVRRAERVYA
jgi:eukaryotic-like serine/threonine-protein kinase